MEITNYLKNSFVVFFMILGLQSFAQIQNMLLPVPGNNSGALSKEGCNVINFSDQNNPIISVLPNFDFFLGNNQGDPNVEEDLSAVFGMDYNYFGQHPMFAQKVVNDKDGNLLFFIVDNNIYNKYGKSFTEIDANGNALGNGYLDYDFFTANVIDRFVWNSDMNDCSLDPEIAVFPIYNHEYCNTYGIVYSFFKRSHARAPYIFYRTLTYVNENEIRLSTPIDLTNYFGSVQGGWCSDECHRGVAICEYIDNTYLLFVRFFHKIFILSINADGSINCGPGNVNISDDLEIPVSIGMLQHNQASSELEVKKIGDDYYLAAGSCYENTSSHSSAYVSIFKFRYTNYNPVVETGYPLSVSLPTGTSSPEQIKGLEFSSNYGLFVTYTGQQHLYNIDITSGGVSYNDNPNFPSNNYQYSQIEIGRDNNLSGVCTISD